jgi:putative nucleotidyltransferase with HDIG domain
MPDKDFSDILCSLSSVLYSFKDAESMCSDVVNLLASAPTVRRSLAIMKGWRGEFHTVGYSGISRGRGLELKNVRCDKDTNEFISQILNDKETVVVDHLPPAIASPDSKGKNVMCPIMCQGKGIGLLIVEVVEDPGSLIKWIDAVARYLSLAIENHTIHNEWLENRIELVQEIETLQLMYEIGKEILFNLRTEEIVETVALMIRRIIPCDGVTMALFDHEKSAFKVIASIGTGLEKDLELVEADVPFYRVAARGKTFYQHDITLVLKDFSKLAEWAEEKNVYSYFCVPLMVKDRLFGALILSSVRSAWFSGTHLAAAEKVATQVGIALSNAKLIEDLDEIFIGTVTSLVKAIDAKSDWTRGHSLRVAEYAVRLAEKAGFSHEKTERMRIAAILHDIGKIGTYEAILDKPGKLTQLEISQIRKHPSQGVDILLPLHALHDIIPIIKYHHERYDGEGYPDGLAGEDIPLEARILAIADVYDAMRSDRPYRKGLTFEQAVQELEKGAGKQFDPVLPGRFVDLLQQSGLKDFDLRE